MTYLLTAGIALITALASVFGVYNYLPLSILQPAPEARLGSTITTIAGTDTLSSSRTTINTNFSNLNAGKFELSDWYATTSATQLTAVGTITTGSWNATAIPVNKGGTGTTTISQYRVLLGNGANGIIMATSTGTTGQFLTSNGDLAFPSWKTGAVDTAANYSWTGGNTFGNSTTTNATTTSLAVINSPSGFLKTDANGSVSAVSNPTTRYIFATTTQITAVNSYATSTVFTIPAGVMTASSTVDFSIGMNLFNASSATGDCSYYLRLTSGVSVVSDIGTGSTIAAADNIVGESIFSILSNNSVSSQNILGNYKNARLGAINNVVATYTAEINTTSSINFANAQSLVVVAQSNAANVSCRVTHIKMVVNK